MYLESISLSRFKNYTECSLQFSSEINCFLGPNGSGKTNLLDAIHYLSLTKSAFNSIDQQNVQHQQDYFSIRGVFHLQGKRHKVQCSYQNGSKKIVKKDNTPYSRLSEHIGRFPSVVISPYDTDILREGSAVRRKFMDSIISQTDRNYLTGLLSYQRLLNQRNHLLKDFALKQRFDPQLIASYDQPMLHHMKKITESRKHFMDSFIPIFSRYYEILSNEQDEVNINYKSDVLKNDFEARFIANHHRDLKLQRTELGVHQDDLNCTIGGNSIRRFGSQGQQKSFVIAMKLAQFELLQQLKGFKPILLLDDIFDKLDDQRIGQLMNMVSGHLFGQIFITDARPERTARILEDLPSEIRKFNIDQGRVVQKKDMD